jgi:hypothetical protein
LRSIQTAIWPGRHIIRQGKTIRPFRPAWRRRTHPSPLTSHRGTEKDRSRNLDMDISYGGANRAEGNPSPTAGDRPNIGSALAIVKRLPGPRDEANRLFRTLYCDSARINGGQTRGETTPLPRRRFQNSPAALVAFRPGLLGEYGGDLLWHRLSALFPADRAGSLRLVS